MCLASFIPAGLTMPDAYVREAVAQNPHGAGIAYARDGEVHIVKGIFRVATLLRHLESLAAYPRAVHMRWATHGSVSKGNCHPFRVARDCAVIHNGIITGYGSKKRSDTAHFTENMLKPSYLDRSLFDVASVKALEWYVGAGNKLVILHAEGAPTILNESSGHWRDGIWYSNESYLPWEEQYYGMGNYASWDDVALADATRDAKGFDWNTLPLLETEDDATRDSFDEYWQEEHRSKWERIDATRSRYVPQHSRRDTGR